VGKTVITFEKCYRQFGKPNIIVALGWWRVVKLSANQTNVKIVSYGGVSTVYPEPSIEEVNEIKMVSEFLQH